jgi:hypothetical protein
MADRLSDVFDRVVACQKELSASWTKTPNAVPYFLYNSSQYPYWTNLLGPWATTKDSDGRTIYQHNITMQLTIGASTGGEAGEYEQLAREWTVSVQDYFARRPNLKSTAYPDGAKWLRETAYISNSSGLLINEEASGKEWYMNFNLVIELGIPTPTS